MPFLLLIRKRSSVEFQDYVLVVFVLAMHILWALSLPNELCFYLLNFQDYVLVMFVLTMHIL